MDSRTFLVAALVPIIGVCTSVSLRAQQDSALTARQLFYTERPKPAKSAGTPKAAPAPAGPAAPASKRPAASQPATPAGASGGPAETAPYLGLRYSVLKLIGNTLEEVNPDAAFRSGDRIKVKVTPNSRSYLYIVHQGTSGNWDILFPSAGFRQGSNAVERLEAISVPEGDYDISFDEKTGTERLFVVLSAQPERDLDALIYSLKSGGQAAGQRVLMASSRAVIPAGGIERLRSQLVSRDLKVDRRPAMQASAKREEAVYVVNAANSGGDGQRVVAEIVLQHQ